MGRSFRLGSYLLWGHFTGGAGRLALQLAQAALQFAECGVKGGDRARERQDSLAMPILGGARALPARKTWQCQSRVARAPSTPRIPGSANPEWRKNTESQKTLAVPELGGVRVILASFFWQCQS